MALVYLDRNSTTLGFGTLTQAYSSVNGLSTSTSDQGTVGVVVKLFGIGSNNELSLGSAGTSANTAVGTVSIPTALAMYCNGIVFQNLTGNQIISSAGTGTLVMHQTSPYIEVTANGRLDITALVSGSVNWQKLGSSILRLTNANTFSAGMTISAGTVEIGNASALGTGTVTMTGGKMSSSSTTGYTLANALTLNGTMTLGDATNTGYITISGTTTISGPTTLTVLGLGTTLAGQLTGSGAFTKTGADNLFLTGTTNNYSGAFTSNTGNMLIGAFNSGTPNQLATAASLTVSGGVLYINGNTAYATFSTPIISGQDIYVTNTASGGVTFTGTSFTGYTGSLRLYTDSGFGAATSQKITSNVWSFADFYFYTGGGLTGSRSMTLVYNGTPALSYGSSLSLLPQSGTGIAAKVENLSTNTLTLTNVTRNLVGSAYTTNTIEYAATTGAITQSAAIQDTSTGSMGFIKSGTNVVTLSGNNTFIGSVSVATGTLNANSATALGLATATTGVSVTSEATLSLGAAATYASRAMTIGGTGTSSTVGALVVANAGTNQFQSITLGSTTYIRATNNATINAPFTPVNNSVIFGASAGSDFTPFLLAANVFSGTGSVTYGSHSGDTGIVRADVRHTYTGNTILAYGTTYVASSIEIPSTSGPLGNKSLTAANTLLMTGGTLSYLNGNTDYSGRFSTAGSQQWQINATDATLSSVTFATALVGASSLRLFGGLLTLSSASSTFSGGVTLTGGTLYAGAAQSGVSGPLGITGTITFSPSGTGVLAYTSASSSFDYSSRFATTNGQFRRIDLNGQDVTFSTAMGGDNAFVLAQGVGGSGVLTLAVANTYTQGTTLSDGTLKCGNVTSLGTGGLVQAGGTTLHVATATGKLTIQGAHTSTSTGNRFIRIGA